MAPRSARGRARPNNLCLRRPVARLCPQDDEVEDPLLEEFKELRRKLFVWPSERRRVAGGGGRAGAVQPCSGCCSLLPLVVSRDRPISDPCQMMVAQHAATTAANRAPPPSLPPPLPAAAGWDDVHPLEYLTPFIETVKSPETNGPITVVALTSLHRIITRSIIGGCWRRVLAHAAWGREPRQTLRHGLQRELEMEESAAAAATARFARRCAVAVSPLVRVQAHQAVAPRRQRPSKRWPTA